MREIKFRGKRVDNGEWVVGDYTRYSNKKSIIMVDLLEEEDYWVSSETVGQYTGLKDKNGKEIYEGDIVAGLFDHTDIIGHIIYGSDATFFIYREGLYGIGLNNAEDWLEVIGNIYENPNYRREK